MPPAPTGCDETGSPDPTSDPDRRRGLGPLTVVVGVTYRSRVANRTQRDPWYEEQPTVQEPDSNPGQTGPPW